MRGLALIAVLTIAAAVAGRTTHAASDPWKALHRPLEVPRIAPGAACPVSEVDASIDFSRFDVGLGLGPGPAYPVGQLAQEGVLRLATPQVYSSRLWGGQKVLWFVRPGYRGHVLIRGRQLDGSHVVRFGGGDVPERELRIERTAPRTARREPSTTRLRATGCYGYQIDGRTFSRVIVFRADWLS